MQNPLKPNHLAKRIDHQKSAASSLPGTLREKCIQLNKLTLEIKTLLDSGLPEEILKSLLVAKYEDGHLVISVQSQTAANHLRYQSQNLINILREQSFTFSQLKNIDVIVTYPASIDHLNESQNYSSLHSKQSNLMVSKGESHITRGLTETTKRTIAHTVEHVIKDERLKKTLERLLKDN